MMRITIRFIIIVRYSRITIRTYITSAIIIIIIVIIITIIMIIVENINIIIELRLIARAITKGFVNMGAFIIIRENIIIIMLFS